MLNLGAVDRILWMGVLCLVTWCVKRTTSLDSLDQWFPYFLRRGALFRTDIRRGALSSHLTLNLLTTTIVVPPSNASKWQVGFNSAFKGMHEKPTNTPIIHSVY